MPRRENLHNTSDLVYPIHSRPLSLLEKCAIACGSTLGFCPVCGRFARMMHWRRDFRESGFCDNCGASNRKRQIAYVICGALSEWQGSIFRSIPRLSPHKDLTIYNTEASGPLHRHLSRLPGYVCSEYLGAGHAPGENISGTRHEDLTKLSFPDSSLDVVISSDILEHVPYPYRAHKEIFRVLRPRGRHIFTVPFLQADYTDDILAESNGATIMMLKPPIYHLDPIRPEGILVYTHFSLEMLLRLATIGYRTNMYRIRRSILGILGDNAIVFEAMKPALRSGEGLAQPRG